MEFIKRCDAALPHPLFVQLGACFDPMLVFQATLNRWKTDDLLWNSMDKLMPPEMDMI